MLSSHVAESQTMIELRSPSIARRCPNSPSLQCAVCAIDAWQGPQFTGRERETHVSDDATRPSVSSRKVDRHRDRRRDVTISVQRRVRRGFSSPPARSDAAVFSGRVAIEKLLRFLRASSNTSRFLRVQSVATINVLYVRHLQFRPTRGA